MKRYRIVTTGLAALAAVGVMRVPTGPTSAAEYTARQVLRPALRVTGPASRVPEVPDIEMLGSPAGPGAGEPFLASAANGRLYLSWLEPADSAFALRVASFDGAKWTAPVTVRAGRDFFVNWADFPSVEVLGDGRLAVHWLQRTGTSTYAYGVRIALSSDGGATWGAPIVPHTDQSPTEHGFVTLWREGGKLGAAWLDGRKFDRSLPNAPNEMSVATTTIDASGTRGAETMLDARACDCCQVAAAVTSNGPVVVYRDRSPDEIRDIAIVRRVGGRWTEPELVHADNWHIAACPVNGPAITASDRAVAVAWFTAASDSPRVKLAFSRDAGATFGAPIRVDDSAPGGRVDLARLSNGDALVSWIERVGGDTAAVRARRVSPSGRASAPYTIATSSTARASGFPRMAVSGERVYFAWTQPGRPARIRVARAAQSDLR